MLAVTPGYVIVHEDWMMLLEYLSILLPIFFIFSVGFIGQKMLHIDIKSVSAVSVYLMTPLLSFSVFYETTFTMDYLYMTLYALTLVLSIVAIVYIIGFIRGYSVRKTCGMILSSAFMNNGNYGTPLVLFVFGEPGLHYAVILMVIQQLIMVTIGVYYAAKGSVDDGNGKDTLKKVLKVPVMYGAILGAVLHSLNLPIGATMLEVIKLVGNAAIPTVMLVLGIQLANVRIKNISYRPLSISLLLKLIVSPVIAWLLTLILPVDEILKQIMILLAGMPAAANTTLYAVQYGTEPDFVSSATFFSTLASLITLPVILSLI